MIVLLLSCTPPTLLSPSEGSVQTGPWIPVLAQVIETATPAEVTLWLDDQDVSDPLGIVRDRLALYGGGHDYLATLELLGLQPGEHVLRLDLGGQPQAESTFTWAPAPHRLTVRVHQDGDPVDARVLVLQDGLPLDFAGPDALVADPKGRDAVMENLFTRAGEAGANVEPGTYRVIAVRSVFDDLASTTIEISEDTLVELELPSAIAHQDTMAADFHVHTGHSSDAYVPDAMRYRALAAAGLDLVAITDHNEVIDPAAALDQAPGVTSWLGSEMATVVNGDNIGHTSVYPLLDTRTPPNSAETLDELLANLRALGEQTVLQLNHPRGIQFWPGEAPEHVHDLYRVETIEVTAGFDTLEIINRFSWLLYQGMRKDWFDLLNSGIQVTGVGNSDSHALQVELAGLPVNLIRCEPVDMDCVVQALRNGEVTVTTGPVPALVLEGGEARVTVQAAPWVPVQELRLVINGEVVVRGPPEEPLTWPLTETQDYWILAEAGWPPEQDAPLTETDYDLVAPGYVPVGFTNPIFVDADGNGRWQR